MITSQLLLRMKMYQNASCLMECGATVASIQLQFRPNPFCADSHYNHFASSMLDEEEFPFIIMSHEQIAPTLISSRIRRRVFDQ